MTNLSSVSKALVSFWVVMIAAAIGAALVVAAGYFGVTQDLGAHPFWAFKVTWIGAPIGVILFLALWRVSTSILLGVVLLALGVACMFAANWGKTEFAASFAENALAGRIWYFGWIGASAFGAAAIAWFDADVMDRITSRS